MGQNRPPQTTRPATSPPGGGSLPRRSLRGMAADLPHWAVGKPSPRGGTAPALKSAAARPGKRQTALPTGREPPDRVRRAPNAGELLFFDMDTDDMVHPLCVGYKKNSYLLPIARAFIDMTIQVYKGREPGEKGCG